MNKTISINLGGGLFNVEEDAYEKLKKYLDDIKNHFAQLDDQGEVVGDIEARIAEQLTERNSKERKTVVTLADVDLLIKTMGTVEDITGATKNNPPAPDAAASEKRLYRDEDRAIIAGVCAGIAAYLDSDPVWVRLIFFASIFFGGSGVLIYIILWIAMPPAKTATEKMEMRGKKITLAGVQETLKIASQTVGGEAKNMVERLAQFVRAILQRVFLVLGKIIQKLGKIITILAGVFITMGSAVLFVGTLVSITLITLPWGNYYLDFPTRAGIHNGLYYGIVAAGLLLIIIPLVFGIILGVSLLRRRLIFTFAPAITLIAVWVASGTALIIMIMAVVPVYNDYLEQMRALPAITREYADKFDQIKIRNAQAVTVVAGPEYKVTARSAEISLNRMDIAVTDGQLNISRKNPHKICVDCEIARLPVEIFITAPSLKNIDISGAEKIEISGFKDDQFNARLENGGQANISLASQEAKLKIWHTDNVTVSGTAPLFNVELYGHGHDALHAFDLKTATATINMSNANTRAEISAEQSLTVISNGEGQVIYQGTPKITEEFNKEALEELRFNYNGSEYPVTIKQIRDGDNSLFEIKIDAAGEDIPTEKIINIKMGDKNYTAYVRVRDDYDKVKLYNIGRAEVAPPSIVEAAK